MAMKQLLIGLLLFLASVGTAPSTTNEEKIAKSESKTPEDTPEQISLIENEKSSGSEEIFLIENEKSSDPADTSQIKNEKSSGPEEISLTEKEKSSGPEDISLIENDKSVGTARQKRWYNFYGGFPPPVLPDYQSRDPFQGFGDDDALSHIHRRLQAIASYVREPALPPVPPPPRFPIFLPVFYIPQGGCNCIPSQTPRPDKPIQPDVKYNGTVPDVNERLPPMEDNRQNWGIITNDTDDDGNEDNSRPLSFEPIPPRRPFKRPPPPVEHGSVQADVNSGIPDVQTPAAYIPPESPSAPVITNPSSCEGATIVCCHQPTVTYNCFANQGCADPGSLGNPCDPKRILQAVEKFQRFYNQRIS